MQVDKKDFKKSNKVTSFKIYNQEEKEQYYLIDIYIEKDILIIHMKIFESKIKLTYENNFTLTNLIKIDKYFRMFDNLEELVQNMNDLQNKKLISINKNQNDNYDFILNVELNKEKIELKLELLFKENNQLIQISEILNSLEKENKELKESLSQYKTKLEKNE